MTVTASEYQQFTCTTAVFRDSVDEVVEGLRRGEVSHGTLQDYLNFSYIVTKLNGEAGELSELVGKALRDHNGVFTATRLRAMQKELGDVLWYCAQMAEQLGMTLEMVMSANMQKLQDRKDRDVLHGSGDDR